MQRPRLKIIRRLGTPLPGLTRKAPEEWKAYPPGAHGGSGGGKRKARPSTYRLRLEEKQKLRFNYGISESQLRRYFERAASSGGVTGEALLALLERRLDNVVFRLGLAPTVPAARQLVAHGHVRVDGARVDRPGYLTRTGETVSMGPRGRAIPDVVSAVEQGPQVRLPGYAGRPFHLDTWRDLMIGKLSLDLDRLAVESFETSRADSKPADPGDAAPLPTCLQTNCGHIQCCA